MAVLRAEDREVVFLRAQEVWSQQRDRVLNMTKDDVREAILEIATAIEASRGLLVSALSEPQRSNLTAEQKLYLFAQIIMRELEVR